MSWEGGKTGHESGKVKEQRCMLKVTQGLELKSPPEQLREPQTTYEGQVHTPAPPQPRGFPLPAEQNQGTSCEAACIVQTHLHCSLTSACLVPALGHRQLCHSNQVHRLGTIKSSTQASVCIYDVPTWTYRGEHRKPDGDSTTHATHQP